MHYKSEPKRNEPKQSRFLSQNFPGQNQLVMKVSKSYSFGLKVVAGSISDNRLENQPTPFTLSACSSQHYSCPKERMG
ncbi:hypothetical protein H5410_025459 [Solanum commersonii]|uniref:Uncharacterized protein n=1 Tax=Solanum commersonii TaxID=4109 RepID=A0A9J5YW10_SOLCO|nr:hypothetical protein H5410_025459 [Solanum commersonii]